MQVTAFLRTCLRALLPPALLGSPHNTRAFIEALLHAYLRGACVPSCVDHHHAMPCRLT